MRAVSNAIRSKAARQGVACPVARVGAALTATAITTASAMMTAVPMATTQKLTSSYHMTATATAVGLNNSLLQQQYRSVVVETNETPNPDCLRFFSMELSFLPEGQSIDMPNNGHAYKSPLAEILFNIDGVKALYFGDEYITVTKEATSDWAEVGTIVKEAISQFAESGVSILSEEGQEEILPATWDTDPHENDTEVVLAIKELLASRIRPMVQGDGGNVRFIGFDESDGMVFVMLEGACKSCPSSGQTLKFGIERMLMHWIPEVTEVQEVDEEYAADYKRQQLEALAKREEEEAAKAAAEGEGAATPASADEQGAADKTA